MLNYAIYHGRFVNFPEVKTTTNGKEFTNFSIAVDRTYTPKGQEKKADFIRCVAWDKTAQFISSHFTKGQEALVYGSMRTNEFTDRDGNKRTSLELLIDGIDFCGSKVQTEQNQNSNPYSAPAYETQTYSSGPADAFETIENDDDLPF